MIVEIRDSTNSLEGQIEFDDLSMNKAISDFKDLTARSGEFTYDITVPATRENNNFLGYLWDANSKNTKDYFADKSATIITQGLQVARGKFRIERSDNRDGRYYKFTFFGSNLEWVKPLSETYLNDLSFDTSSFTYNKSTIKSSWTNGWSDEHVFALINRGRRVEAFDTNVEDFYPDLFLKSVLTKAVNGEGYTFDSNFFDTSNFEGLILTYFNEEFEQPVSFKSNREYEVSPSQNRTFRMTGSGHDTYGENTTEDLQYDNEISDPGNVWSSTIYTADQPHKVSFSAIARLSIPSWEFDPTSPLPDADHPYFTVQIVRRDSGGTFIETIGESVEFGDSTTNKLNIEGNVTDISVSTNEVRLEDGDQVAVKVQMEGLIATAGTPGTNQHYSAEMILFQLNSQVTNNVSRRIIEGQTFTLNDVLDGTQMSMLDLINDVSRMFNLYWQTDTATKQIKVEPRDDFYNALSTADDYTAKVDHAKGWEIVDNSRLYKQNLDFRYNRDQTDKYLENQNKTKEPYYAAYDHDFGDSYEEGVKTVKTKHIAPTFWIEDKWAGNVPSEYSVVTSRLWKESTVDPPEQTVNFKPRILNYKYAGQTNSAGVTRSFLFDGAVTNTIPYALPRNFASTGASLINLNFSSDDDQGLVKTYYGKTIKTIEDGKRLVIYLELSLHEYQRFDFRTPIYIGAPPEIQGYWYVERIDNFTGEGTTKFTLNKARNYGSATITQIDGIDLYPHPVDTIGMDTESGSVPGGGFGFDNQLNEPIGSIWMGHHLIVNPNQIVLGQYNLASTSAQLIIGAGDKDSRSNFLVIDENGEVTLGGGDVVTEKDGQIIPVYTEVNGKFKVVKYG